MPVLGFDLNKKYSEVSIFSLRVCRLSLFKEIHTGHQMIIFQLFQISTNWGSNFMSHMLNEKKSNWLLNWLVTPILKNRSKFLQSKVSARLYDCRLICGGGFFAGKEKARNPRHSRSRGMFLPSYRGICGIKSQEIGKSDYNVLVMR